MNEKDVTGLFKALGPTEEDRKRFAGTFFGTLIGQSVVLLGLIVSYVAAVALLYKFAGKDLAAFHASVGSIWFWLMILAPLAFIAVFSMMPTALRAWRERRLFPLAATAGVDTPGYFRLHPYDARDRERYTRPDAAVEQTLDWLFNTPHSLLYLAGASGSGKSSLIAAGVIPELEDAGWDVLQTRILGAPSRHCAGHCWMRHTCSTRRPSRTPR